MLPLGDAWAGTCLARPGEPLEPDAADLSLCNLGYARGVCPRFPEETAADAVRFAVARHAGGSLQIYYVLERGHHPLEHGQLEFDFTDAAFHPALPETPFHQQARAYVSSFQRRKKDAVASE